MASDREIALEQALIAVIAAAVERGCEGRGLVDRAAGLLLGGKIILSAGRPHVEASIREIGEAYNEMLYLDDWQ